MDDLKDSEIVQVLYRDFPKVYIQIVEYLEQIKWTKRTH